MVTVRRVIILLSISRRPLLICLHCCLHQYKTLKAVATAIAAIVLLTPAKNLNKVFWGFQVVSPLFNHYHFQIFTLLPPSACLILRCITQIYGSNNL
jgi:hypothetical protein